MVALRILVTCSLAATLTAAVSPTVVADHEYQQPVWFTWDTTQLDVLVVGIEDPLVGAAIRDAIEAWQVGLPQYAPAWLADAHVIRTYLVGLDPLPPAGFEADDVEVYFLPQGFAAVNTCGIDFSCPNGQHCYATAPTGPLNGYAVAAHEFGHCLGLGHVFNHGVEYEPSFDIMGSGNVPSGKACPSNLNVAVLERAYGGLFGLPSGGQVTMGASSYAQSTC